VTLITPMITPLVTFSSFVRSFQTLTLRTYDLRPGTASVSE
jgi:hypothetical protein